MNRVAILNAMENKARRIFDESGEYVRDGRRGMLTVEIRDPKNPSQWHSSTRNFGVAYRDYAYEGELVINNGTNFDALVHGKVAFTRRTEKDSGTNYYQVLGCESFWPGAVISDDGNCICAFAGFTGTDDKLIAKAGITCYESLKRTGKSVDIRADHDYEEAQGGEDDEEAGADQESEAEEKEDI
jgi:hypothetical protein